MTALQPEIDAPARPMPAVTAAVLFVDAESLPVSIEAVRNQAYGMMAITVLGSDEAITPLATEAGADHFADFQGFLAGIGSDVDYIWLVHGDSRPRPDAVGALIEEAERNEASMVGSKILDAAEPDRLESVGAATDVFGEPYSGLDPGEVDLEQYDVVRDVAFLSAVSVLVRRDLLRGLGGIDLALAPSAAGLDLSQRARIAGGRVMVVPSSEVLHLRHCRENLEGWREQAGRMRAMLKAYSWVTLFWAIPLGAIVGLFDGMARLLLGSPRALMDYVRAAGWNLARLPSTLATRASLRPIRVARDVELFRYQVGGSVRLRTLFTGLAERFGWIIDEEPGVVTEEEMEADSSPFEAITVAAVLAAVLIAARQLWVGSPPANGFSLPTAADASSVLATFAGGWNPTELGSPESLHPAPGLVAAVQTALGGFSGTQGLLTLASLVLGVVGLGRLLKHLGLTGVGRYAAGIVLLLGPFAGRLAGYWPGWVALGFVPWMLDSVLSPWPGTWRLRAGRVGRIVLTTAPVAALAPSGPLVAVAAAITGWAVVGRPGSWRGVAGALGAVVAGMAVISAYLLGVAPAVLADPGIGVSVWPAPVAVALALVALATTSVTASGRRGPVVRWGGLMLAVGVSAGAVPQIGGEYAVAAVLAATLGSATVVGAALSVDLSANRAAIAAQTLGATASIVLLVMGLSHLPGGSAGFPDDLWSDRLDFVAGLDADAGPDRVLLVGPPEELPGATRVSSGHGYRLVLGPIPTLDQAWLPTPRVGDEALAQALAVIERRAEPRPGGILAEFAIRWVVVLGDVPISESLRAQLDLAERPVEPGMTIYENLAARPRAEPDQGGAWVAARTVATGPTGGGRVRLADNADPGWQPDGRAAGWANNLSAGEGLVSFRPDPARRAAATAAGLIVLLSIPLTWWGRERS